MLMRLCCRSSEFADRDAGDEAFELGACAGCLREEEAVDADKVLVCRGRQIHRFIGSSVIVSVAPVVGKSKSQS